MLPLVVVLERVLVVVEVVRLEGLSPEPKKSAH